MKLQFSSADIKKWADFSGDYNPIHFDLERAKGIGAEGIIVHGMLVLLPLKQIVHDRLTETKEHLDWLRFNVVLRDPVIVDNEYVLSIKDNSAKKMRFSLRSVSDAPHVTEHIRGFITSEASVEREPWQTNRSPIHQTVPFSSFVREFDFVKDEWLWLDSIAFSVFIRSHLDLPAGLEDKPPSWVENGLDSCEYVQTSQEVMIAPSVLNNDAIKSDIATDSLTYSFRSEVASATEQGIVGMSEIALHDGDEMLLISRYGLMARPIAKK